MTGEPMLAASALPASADGVGGDPFDWRVATLNRLIAGMPS